MRSTGAKKCELLYKECETCTTIGDCPHPEVAQDMMGSVMPPEGCLKPIDVMRETLKKKKHDRV